jgi:predicted NUDIX family NTP pyrophosphohydrolase
LAKGRHSAGLLLYRGAHAALEVLLAHPGGPFWRRKDAGAWTIPKGEVEAGEEAEAAARREFAEEIGFRPEGERLHLGTARQPGGKLVEVWATEGDWDPSTLASNAFAMEWPPRSGRTQTFPEVDRAGWFRLDEARRKILKGQAVFLERLELAIGDGGESDP